ncbi:protein of unknown function [Nitrospira japonica]|uniref:Uncharacterized protein n=1 Tax=Nitrospira japonica TaxID=1325564 RepID=A0A1W1I0H4_9BACT|nr:hypothetical protein [Nitrospira japonica]SLM46508.1 protein of unknown function [Nitrospira japonica]
MPAVQQTTDQILEAVREHPDCTLDELVEHLPAFHWSHIFLEVDHLSRTGRLQLIRTGSGFVTTLRISKPRRADERS